MGTTGAVFALLLTVAIGSPIVAFRINIARQQAEEARKNEEDLRVHVRWKDQVVAAAQILISNREFDQADSLIHSVPQWARRVDSRDAARVFYALANWHGASRRWEQAAEYYSGLFEPDLIALKVDWDTVISMYPEYGLLLVGLGDVAGYQRLRQSAIATFRDHIATGTCARMLNACLLLPPTLEEFTTLSTWAHHAAGVSQYDGSRFWCYEVLALYEYRRHNYGEALLWARKTLEGPGPEVSQGALV